MQGGEPSLSLRGVLSAAYRRARRAGKPVVGTDLVLYYAAVRVPALWQVVPGHFDRSWRPVRRGTAGLTDPDPPAPTRLHPAFDDEVAFEAAAVLRRGRLIAAGSPRPLHRRGGWQGPSPVFSRGVQWAVYEALHEARRCGVRHARPEHLVFGLLTLPGGAAIQLLSQWTMSEPWQLLSLVRLHPTYHTDGDLSQWAVDGLTVMRVLPPARDPKIWRGPWRLAAALASVPITRPYRRYGARYGHPLLFLVELYAPDVAAYTGHDQVTAAHVLVTMVELHEQLTAAGKQLRASLARWNSAGEILARHGVHYRAALHATARLRSDPADDEDNRDAVPRLGWLTIRTRRGVPGLGRTALLALREASHSAHRLGHPCAGTTHLLAALLTEPNGPAVRLLRALGVDPKIVRAEAQAAVASPLAETDS